jgi:hypothetical protein
VETDRRVVRKQILQPAKLRRPSTPHGKCFLNAQKCRTSLPAGADSRGIRRIKSNKLSQSHAESGRCSSSHNVMFSARRYSQTLLHPGNLYGLPTAARSISKDESVSQPKRFLPVRSRILRALPLARATIPRKSDFMLVPEHLRLAGGKV